jgi:hypothetical protein
MDECRLGSALVLEKEREEARQLVDAASLDADLPVVGCRATLSSGCGNSAFGRH